MTIFANKEDKSGKAFSMPRETYMKDKGNGSCKLMLNPSDMQIGAHYGETQWVMGDQFMQAFYTIFDHEKRRVGLIQSSNTFDSMNGGSTEGSDKAALKEIIQGDSKKDDDDKKTDEKTEDKKTEEKTDDKKEGPKEEKTDEKKSAQTLEQQSSNSTDSKSSPVSNQESVQTSEEQAFFNFEIK